jgi:hypothetical protein
MNRGEWASALVLLCTGCVTGGYNRDRIHQELAPAAVYALQPGESQRDDVQALLGAPLYVVELDRNVALAYGWLDQTAWNVAATVPVGDASASFRYTDSGLTLPGLVVFLDESYVVERIDRGLLRDLLPDRARPMLVEEPEE